MNLVEASLIRRDEKSGIRQGDLDKLQRMHQQLETKAQNGIR